MHKDDIKDCLSAYHEAFDKKTPIAMEYRMKRSDGVFRWVLNAAVPSFDSNNQFTGYIGSVTEIHDKRMMNEEMSRLAQERTAMLIEVNENLEKSNNELQQFTYIATHDMQEPLRKIITFSERLREKHPEVIESDSDGYLDKIARSSKRMTKLIDGLLDFSKAARITENMAEVNLDEVIQNVINDFELTIEEKKARVIADKLPVIEGIPLQISQLFFNLVGNSLKFSGEKAPPKIQITCKKLTEGEKKEHPELDALKTYYRISFKDEGIGFRTEFAQQIFVIFQRLNDRQQYAGTGIGLALCKKIVDNHLGKIYAKSEPGNGAEFVVILPEKQME